MRIAALPITGTPTTHCQKSRHPMNLITPTDTIFKKMVMTCRRKDNRNTESSPYLILCQIPVPCSFIQVSAQEGVA
jgi:hypothetical protein